MPGQPKRRRRTPVVLAAIAILPSPCWGGVCWCVAKKLHVRYAVWTDEDRAHARESEEGLPSDARRWIGVIEPLASPDTAEPAIRPQLTDTVDFFQHRFPNGEWVFGIEIASHQLFSNGGTTVTKDSNGRVRVFFGHVCTLGNADAFARGCMILSGFYESILQTGM